MQPNILDVRNNIIEGYHYRKELIFKADSPQKKHEMQLYLDGVSEVFSKVFGESLDNARIR